MKSKTLLNFLGALSDFQFNMLFTNEDDEICKPSSITSTKRTNRNLDDFQIFTDHLKLNERFKKTLYYGKLPPAECPSLPLSDVTLELFTKTVPNGGLDVLDMHYAASVSRKACISPCSMILALMYLDQLRHKNPEYLQNVSSCDLFLISMLVASKFLYDDGEDDEVFNAEWACSANIDVKDLNNLEREFLAALDWEVFAKPTEFFRLLHEIECKIALQEIPKRGWFSYTDIYVLAQNSVPVGIITILVDNVIKVLVITAVAYVAAVMTLFGASKLCQRCIPLMQNYAQVMKVGSAHASLVTATSSALNSETTSEVVLSEAAQYEKLTGDWFETVVSSAGPNETVFLNSNSHPGISSHGKTEHATFLHGDYRDYCKIRSKLFANGSVEREFMASGVITDENDFSVYIEPCFPPAVPLHPKCICRSELQFCLYMIYDVDYTFRICGKYFSKTLKA